MDYFYQIEERDGARFSYNVWPSNKTETTKAAIPIGCMYSPLRRGTTAPRVGYDPVTCKTCKICLNPYCPVDINAKLWTCVFCGQRNQFPPHYSGMTESNLPAELLPNITTIEYVLARQQRSLPPVFLFVVDTCISADELQALKDSLMQTLESLPQNAFVGLIAFGTVVQVYELAFTHMTRAHVFRGNKEPTPKEVQHMLGIPLSLEGHAQPQPRNNFILPLAQAEESIQRIIEELQRDPRVVKSGTRPLRATGPAVAAAVTMLENTFPNTGAHIMVFMGGPATQGPGQIVTEELKETIRSHHDLVKESAKYVAKSGKFYQALAERAAKNGHAIDLFGVSLDQVGFLEMGSLSKKTGGLMVVSDTFEHEIFRKSLQKMFEKDADGNLRLAFNSTLEVFTSREVKVMGAIGHMSSLNKKQPNVSENELGIGGTSAWKICSFDPNSTFAIYFDVVASAANPIPRGQNAMVQFHTLYHLSSGQPVLRVTTLAYGYADPSGGPAAILAGMDQEACAALMTRVAVWRGENDDPAPIKWLDRQLIRVMARYGEYRKGEITSFQIPASINLYPQFMFHLRRGLLIQVFGSSPDETVFFRHCALRENVPNTLVMIQPTLDAYSFDSEPVPVMLSVTSIQPDRILLLDTFFHVVIFHGETVAAWRKAGYHEKAEYANLKELLAAPQDDAKDLIENRFPHPIFVDCDQGGSQARFILAILDPAVTHMTNAVPGQPNSGSGGVIFTEDISMKSFMDALKKRAVDYEQ